MTITFDLENLVPAGRELNEDPFVYLRGRLAIAGVDHHLEGFSVVTAGDGRQHTESPLLEPFLSAHLEAAGADGPVYTIGIYDRQYAFIITPAA